MSVLTRWTDKLRARRKLLDRANRSVAYWSRRATTSRGRQMLKSARARVALRRTQVDQAERVVARHDRNAASSISDAGVAFVAGFEGFRSRPYRNFPTEPLTIGYGETKGVRPGMVWTRKQALTALRRRLNADYYAPVLRTCKAVGFKPTQREADAIASLVYNLGPGILERGRSMGDALRSKSRRRIAAAFLVYDKADGRTWPGLTRRRKAERAMFLRG